MKIPSLLLSLLGAALIVATPRMALADDAATTTAPTAPSDGTPTCGPNCHHGQRLERFKQAMAQLDLTDAQKEQMKQIRATVTDPQERREQIMNVLTPEQKAKLQAMIQAHRNAADSGGTTPAAN